MFTGLVQDLGLLQSRDDTSDGSRLRVDTRLGSGLKPGDSVAVNGACLTVVEADVDGFSAEVMAQTLSLTALGGLEPGEPLNLEPAAMLGDRLGGHLVQGHVDGVGEISAIREDGIARRLRVTLPAGLARYVIPQGSITLNGVSLTISDLSSPQEEAWFEVSLIPETRERTNLGAAKVGTLLNIECDVIARYVERLLEARSHPIDHEEDPQPWKPDG